MKKIVSSTIVATIILFSLSANHAWATFVNSNAVPVKISLTALIQSPAVSVTNGSTVTETFKTTKVKIANQDIINILQSEFSTSFPLGAVLVYDTDFHGFAIADANGNIIKNVSTNSPPDSNYRFDLTNHISGPTIQAAKSVEDLITTDVTVSGTVYEPGYFVFYEDGNGNDFNCGGLVTAKVSGFTTPSINEYKSLTLVVSGSGSGTFFNPNDGDYDDAVITGSITLSGKNILQ